jgi:hypothetical protein
MDFLKSAVASAMAKGPPFPYTFGDKVDLDPSIWTLYNGTRRVCPLQHIYRLTRHWITSSDLSPNRKTAPTAAYSRSTSRQTDPPSRSPRTR